MSRKQEARTLKACEVAALLGVSEPTMYRHLRQTGHINGVSGIRSAAPGSSAGNGS